MTIVMGIVRMERKNQPLVMTKHVHHKEHMSHAETQSAVIIHVMIVIIAIVVNLVIVDVTEPVMADV